jgi:hypothetical protein
MPPKIIKTPGQTGRPAELTHERRGKLLEYVRQNDELHH